MLDRDVSLRMPNFFAYFLRFMTEAPIYSRIILIVYFTMYLLAPIFGKPVEAGGNELVSGIGLGIFDIVLLVASLAIFHYNRNLSGNCLTTGMIVFLIMISPVVLLGIALFLGAISGAVIVPLLAAASSALFLVPLVFTVIILIEGVIHYHNKEGENLLLIGMAFFSIFLMMYTFATIYHLNGLVNYDSGAPVTNFYEVFYFSGVTWTTLGYGDMVPTGMGKILSVIESMMGWVLMSLITAIFLRILIGGAEQEE